MRLAYIDPHPVPGEQPECLQILQTANALAEAGLAVRLVTPVSSVAATEVLGREAQAGLVLVGLADQRKRWWYPKRSNRLFYRQALSWLAQNQVDAILVRNLKLAAILLKTPNLPPIFFETHEVFAQTYQEEHPQPNWLQRRKWAALAAREALVYRASCGILALTQLLVDDIAQTYGVATPCVVVADGVDLELAAKAKVLNQVEIHQPARLLYLGSLHPWKGVETLIRVMPKLVGAELWIAGGGEARIAELKHLAVELKVAPESVRFLGSIEPIKRFELIAQADICLLPLTQTSIGSRYTSPLKLFEYMAMNKAIVIADLPSIREVLVDGETALLAECESADSFADKLTQLLAQPELAQRLANNAGKLAQSYSWLARAHKIRAFIEQQLNTLG